jgi:hypothetical protein
MVTVYKDGLNYTNCNVNIISNSYIDNSLIVEKENGQQYKFYVDDARNYYLDETINVTFNDKMEIIDCAILSEPQIYNTQIGLIKGTIATLSVNGQSYLFENTEGLDGWKTGEKCKVIIQDGKLLEVRPIPLNER